MLKKTKGTVVDEIAYMPKSINNRGGHKWCKELFFCKNNMKDKCPNCSQNTKHINYINASDYTNMLFKPAVLWK